MKICPTCGTGFMVKRSHFKWRKFCSFKCKGEYMETLIGQNARNWQGGRESQNARFRSRLQYEEWKQAVLLRDNFCLMCGSDENLHAHHIIPIREDNTRVYNVDNGMVLCKWCHHMTHSPKARSPLTTYNFEMRTWT